MPSRVAAFWPTIIPWRIGRQAQWQPVLLDRTRRDNWVRRGQKDMFARANERAGKILSEHTVAPLPEAAESAIDEVLKRRGA